MPKISQLPSATGPILEDDILLLVREGVTYQISGDEHGIAGVSSFNNRQGNVVLTLEDLTAILNGSPVVQNGTPFRIYATNASGQQALITYSQGGTLSLTVAQRTSQGQIDASTVPDTHAQAGDNNLVNRAYVQDLRTDRIITINSEVQSYTIPADRDGIIVSGTNTLPLEIVLPSALTKYKRILIKFTSAIAALTISPGLNSEDASNSIDYSPTSVEAGDLFEWSYDVQTSTWLITNYVSFNSLP